MTAPPSPQEIVLDVWKLKAANIPDCTQDFTLDKRRGVPDRHLQSRGGLFFFAIGHDPFHVAGLSHDVDGHNGFCIFGNPSFHIGKGQAGKIRDRGQPGQAAHGWWIMEVDGAHVGIGRGDHFVAWPYSQRFDAGIESLGAGAGSRGQIWFPSVWRIQFQMKGTVPVLDWILHHIPLRVVFTISATIFSST